jgi:hypothetical protein
MIIKRIVMTISVFLTFLAVISTGAGTAAAEPDLPACQTTPWRSEVVQQWETGSWGYLYRVIWCVEDATIKWAVSDIVPVLPDDSNCTWGGMSKQDLGPVGGSDSWTGFSMGWFSCPDPTDNDYPWGIVMIHPDGTSEIPGQGTA